MISLPRSVFDRSRRRALIFTAEGATVYHWDEGQLTDSFMFDADETGVFHFARYLQETPNSPLYFLVDVVEEEYRQETIPHILGQDRRALIRRKTERLFRGVEYTRYLNQGREEEGRRDDKILLTALTNADALTPWIQLFERYRVPLAGIYSLPIVSEVLLPEIGAHSSANVLLVSLQSNSGLRQSFFRGGHLKMSRLAKLPRFGTSPYGPYVMEEIDKLNRYLKNLHLLWPEEPLDIYILSHGELLDNLMENCLNSRTLRYHLVDVAGLGKHLGIEGVLTTTFSDVVYAHLLLRNSPKNYYASGEEITYFSMHRLRVGMLAASIVALLGGAIWSGINFVDGISLKHRAIEAHQKALFYEERFRDARAELPTTAVEPNNIKQAIDIVDTLRAHKATPFKAMTLISDILADYPHLHIDIIEWEADPDRDKPDKGLPSHAVQSQTEQDNATHYQIAHVEGHLEPFNGNYRAALTAVERFVETLRSARGIVKVDIKSLPINVSSQSKLAGMTQHKEQDGQASFSIQVTLGMGNGRA